MTRHHWNALLGAGCVAFALLALFWWIPHQTESGVVVEVRHQVSIGDAMAPTVWAIGIGLLGLLLGLQGLLRLREASPEAATGGPTAANLRRLSTMLAIVAVSLWLMTAAGPAVVKLAQALGADLGGYRALRAERPWKYIGYMTGGFAMSFGLMSWVAGRPSWRLALVAAAVVVGMALAYDLPFRNLQLPPNGDQ